MLRHDLISAIRQKRSFLCVGLDTELSKLPEDLPRNPEGALAFNKAIIAATRDLCVAYKPNLAFYEAMGPAGWMVFEETVRYIGREHFIIADAKRGDIGNTSRMYADAFFNRFSCDAVTVAPYMGADSVQPFLAFPGKWAIVLALTSNRGSDDFQQITEEGSRETLYEKVLRRCQAWGRPDNLMFVVGATHPEAFEQVRRHAPDHFLLVPGVGAQGGDLQAICRYGLNADVGLLVNASRSILYASGGADFAEAARAEAKKMQHEMADILDNRWP
jgi:orotidine-5'-phosphate decarboxylase